jgi:phosphoglycolate phosphatase-like HAD superfamily hydrolase
LGVLSNKAEEMVKIIVDALFSDIPWKVVTGKREGYPHKPDPRSLLALCDHMDIDPSKVIYVGIQKWIVKQHKTPAANLGR